MATHDAVKVYDIRYLRVYVQGEPSHGTWILLTLILDCPSYFALAYERVVEQQGNTGVAQLRFTLYW